MSAAVNGLFNGIDILDAGNVIFQPQWTDDSKNLTFLGRNGQENRQLFRVNLSTHEVVGLTPANQDVLAYSRSQDSYAYLTGADAKLQAEQAWQSEGPSIPDISIGTGTPLMQLLYPHFKGNAFGEPVDLELWQIRRSVATPVVDRKTNAAIRIDTRYTNIVLSLSPDATQLATIAYNELPESIPQSGTAGSTRPQLHYQIIDLPSGARSSILNEPVVDFHWAKTGRYRASWSPDGSEIVLTEVEQRDKAAGLAAAPQKCDVTLVRVITRNEECLQLHDETRAGLLYSVGWDSPASKVVIRYKTPGTFTYFDETIGRKGNAWTVANQENIDFPGSLQLSVREDLNNPPVLVARDTVTGRSRTIFDPNPQLEPPRETRRLRGLSHAALA
jgi:hypothetical protein